MDGFFNKIEGLLGIAPTTTSVSSVRSSSNATGPGSAVGGSGVISGGSASSVAAQSHNRSCNNSSTNYSSNSGRAVANNNSNITHQSALALATSGHKLTQFKPLDYVLIDSIDGGKFDVFKLTKSQGKNGTLVWIKERKLICVTNNTFELLECTFDAANNLNITNATSTATALGIGILGSIVNDIASSASSYASNSGGSGASSSGQGGFYEGCCVVNAIYELMSIDKMEHKKDYTGTVTVHLMGGRMLHYLISDSKQMKDFVDEVKHCSGLCASIYSM
jgi:hypothetical protein